ncbi:hypothetical protein E05_19020 [Plautia stali symbiont]|nr:hypothetical protein E05_19020 [Plautia stali symbiont]
MKYAIGPVLWYWPTATLEQFYQRAAESSAEIVYLGEAVCSKRRATAFSQWMGGAARWRPAANRWC